MKSITCGSCGQTVTNSEIEKHVAEKHFGDNPTRSGTMVVGLYPS